jgi:hypothetical protein
MRLPVKHRSWVYASSVLLFLSGAVWLLFHNFVRVRGEFGVVAHPLEIWWLRLHGASAMLSLAVLGSLLPIHVRHHWNGEKNRLAGTLMGAIALLLIGSGYALYYFGSEATRPWISALHWLLGIAALPILIWHVVSGRRSMQRGRASAGASRGQARGKAAFSDQPDVS